MNKEEFEMQLALGLITLNDLKEFQITQKILTSNEKIVLTQSCIHLVLIKVNNNGGRIYRKNIWYPGSTSALKRAEIFGWIKRNFSYEQGAGRNKPLHMTELGYIVFNKLQENNERKHVLCPIEINYDALFGFINRGKNYGR